VVPHAAAELAVGRGNLLRVVYADATEGVAVTPVAWAVAEGAEAGKADRAAEAGDTAPEGADTARRTEAQEDAAAADATAEVEEEEARDSFAEVTYKAQPMQEVAAGAAAASCLQLAVVAVAEGNLSQSCWQRVLRRWLRPPC
jgi:hypothetical protein